MQNNSRRNFNANPNGRVEQSPNQRIASLEASIEKLSELVSNCLSSHNTGSMHSPSLVLHPPSTKPKTVSNNEPEEREYPPLGRHCYNCSQYGHSLNECPKPLQCNGFNHNLSKNSQGHGLSGQATSP